MDDRTLVELLVAGDPSGLAGVYDTYADRLYAYCTVLLRNREAAADALHDTLLVARERATQLRDPSRLRPWLYAIARNECMRALRDRQRTAELDEAGEMTDESADLEAGLRADEMRELVWAAAESLNPGEREVLELSVRHGLEGADLADALGVPLNQAHTQMSRARTQLERALAVLIVARTGRQDCAELDGMLGDWDGHLTPLLRKRLGRHLERCDICGEQRRRRVSAAALLAGVPIAVAPPALRDRFLHEAGDMRLVAMWETLAARAGPYRPDGFPRPLGRGRRRAVVGWWAAGVAALALLILGAITVLPQSTPKPAADAAIAAGSTDPASTAATSTEPPSSTVDTTTTTAAPITTTPAPTTTAPLTTTVAAPPPITTTTPAAVTTTPRRTTTSRTTTTPPPPPPPTITASSAPNDSFCANENEWFADFTARIVPAGTIPDAMTATWTAEGKPQGALQMTRGRTGVWTVETPALPSGVTVVWHATGSFAGTSISSNEDKITFTCPRPPG